MTLRWRRYLWHLVVFGWTADWRHALEVEHYRFTLTFNDS